MDNIGQVNAIRDQVVLALQQQVLNNQEQQEQEERPRVQVPIWGENDHTDTTWTSFITRFQAWCQSEEADEDQAKSYLFQAIRGPAASMVLTLGPTSLLYNQLTFEQYRNHLDAIFRPAGDVEIARSAYRERRQGREESIQAYFMQKQTLFTLAFPERNSEVDTELIADLGMGINNPNVARIVLATGPYDNVEQLYQRASRAVAAERQLFLMGMTKNNQGLAISGVIQANLATYQLTSTTTQKPGPVRAEHPRRLHDPGGRRVPLERRLQPSDFNHIVSNDYEKETHHWDTDLILANLQASVQREKMMSYTHGWIGSTVSNNTTHDKQIPLPPKLIKTKILIDSGNLLHDSISESCAKSLSANIKPISLTSCKAANKTQMMILGIVAEPLIVKFNPDGGLYSFTPLVIRGLSHPVNLSSNFGSKHDAILHFSSRTLLFPNERVLLGQGKVSNLAAFGGCLHELKLHQSSICHQCLSANRQQPKQEPTLNKTKSPCEQIASKHIFNKYESTCRQTDSSDSPSLHTTDSTLGSSQHDEQSQNKHAGEKLMFADASVQPQQKQQSTSCQHISSCNINTSTLLPSTHAHINPSVGLTSQSGTMSSAVQNGENYSCRQNPTSTQTGDRGKHSAVQPNSPGVLPTRNGDAAAEMAIPQWTDCSLLHPRTPGGSTSWISSSALLPQDIPTQGKVDASLDHVAGDDQQPRGLSTPGHSSHVGSANTAPYSRRVCPASTSRNTDSRPSPKTSSSATSYPVQDNLYPELPQPVPTIRLVQTRQSQVESGVSLDTVEAMETDTTDTDGELPDLKYPDDTTSPFPSKLINLYCQKKTVVAPMTQRLVSIRPAHGKLCTGRYVAEGVELKNGFEVHSRNIQLTV